MSRSALCGYSARVPSPDVPCAIRSCWLSWIAVRTDDRQGVISYLGLTGLAEVAWADGVRSIDEAAHHADTRYSRVLVTPSVEGWVLVVGPWCALPDLARTAQVTDLCLALSSRYEQAQAFFFGEQGDGDAWLIAERGAVFRRWISEYPELALGAPFGFERQSLDAAGIRGRPENLDPEDDLEGDRLSAWECDAPAVAAESSLDPRRIGPQTQAGGRVLMAVPPTPEVRDPFAHAPRA